MQRWLINKFLSLTDNQGLQREIDAVRAMVLTEYWRRMRILTHGIRPTEDELHMQC